MKERPPVAYRFQEAICSKARPRAVRIPAAGTLSGFKEVGEPVRFETRRPRTSIYRGEPCAQIHTHKNTHTHARAHSCVYVHDRAHPLNEIALGCTLETRF